MSGRRPAKNGAWATCWGRSIIHPDEVLLPQVLADNGYRTAMFGKWHLGDNYPYRPFDRGFQHVVAHRGGGVGQTPDFWGNNYFDDTYFHNGEAQEHDGYCTDIWFDECRKFIETAGNSPFFCYLATNAPHSPYLVAPRYRKPYEDNPEIPEPGFYGMIENIDENVGKLRAFLEERGLTENTILIFMTDNGSSGGADLDDEGHLIRGYNAGMRGKKGSFFDGGHRVPCFVHWPAGNLAGGRDVEELCCDIDLLPTLLELCGLADLPNAPRDGRSFAPMLRGESESFGEDRHHFLLNRQGTEPPQRDSSAVMTRRWRLVRTNELYDMKTDPGQTINVAENYPEVTAKLQAAFTAWYDEIEAGLSVYSPIALGNPAENPTRLDAMDVMGDVAWHQTHIALAEKTTGTWTVSVDRPGRYRFRLRRWPEELDLPLGEGVTPEHAQNLIYAPEKAHCETIAPNTARVAVGGAECRMSADPAEKEVVLELELERTPSTTLNAWFTDEYGEEYGAYYVYVEHLT